MRICIHRRENTHDRRRFLVLFDAMESLVRRGHQVLFIRLFGTNDAITRFGLQDRLDALSEEFPRDFISSEAGRTTATSSPPCWSARRSRPTPAACRRR